MSCKIVGGIGSYLAEAFANLESSYLVPISMSRSSDRNHCEQIISHVQCEKIYYNVYKILTIVQRLSHQHILYKYNKYPGNRLIFSLFFILSLSFFHYYFSFFFFIQLSVYLSVCGCT